jgi:apoptosis-inducing factor 3
MGNPTPLSGPDLSQGVPLDSLRSGEPLLGHFEGKAVILVRDRFTVRAVSATCTHYSGPLAEGLVVGNTVRCPWHHACFDLDTGAARGPGLNPLTAYDVELTSSWARVLGEREPTLRSAGGGPDRGIAIIGLGPAGMAAAEALREAGYRGTVTLLGAEGTGPVDRPNLSKDFLSGAAPEEWLFTRDEATLKGLALDVHPAETVTSIDPSTLQVSCASGLTVSPGAVLLATGSEPTRPAIPGAELPHVFTLRAVGDAKALLARVQPGVRVVILGASFIGLEVAASLRARQAEVHVVGAGARPLAHVFGEEVGAFLQGLHESHGVAFTLGRRAVGIESGQVLLEGGQALPADVVVLGTGVRPRVELAKAAGARVANGVVVDGSFETSVKGLFAAGDVARYPDPRSGALVRVEHWAASQRQGRAAALAMLGRAAPFTDVPFFWSQHHDVTLSWVGHLTAPPADVEVKGSLASRDAAVVYREGGQVRAVLTLFRDRLSLEVEAALEQLDFPRVEQLLG